jgi:ketosteroid isomerase-like protein
MVTNNVALAKAYYEALNEKNISKAEHYLHPDVSLLSPLGSLQGKQEVVKSLHHFIQIYDTLSIRAAMGDTDQVMLAVDLHCPAPIGLFRTAILLDFKDGKIYSSELFYDGRPLEKKANAIFNA